MRLPSAPWLRELHRALSWHRRSLAAVLAGASVLLGLTALAPAPPPTVPVLATTRDLPGGATLADTDVQTVALPPAAVPEGALRPGDPIAGRTLAAPLRRGVPLTDVALVGSGLLAGYGEELVAAFVRLADAGATRLLRTGDVVDVLAADASLGAADSSESATVGPARVVAAAARVVAVPSPEDGIGTAGEGALVVLAVRREVAAELAGAAATARLSATLRPS